MCKIFFKDFHSLPGDKLISSSKTFKLAFNSVYLIADPYKVIN